MKRLSILLPALFAIGCAGEAYVVETAPPPPRSEVVTYRPGYVYVSGTWSRHGGSWHWREGRFVRERPNYVYMQPRWERRGKNYVYLEGTWRPRGSVYVERH